MMNLSTELCPHCENDCPTFILNDHLRDLACSAYIKESLEKLLEEEPWFNHQSFLIIHTLLITMNQPPLAEIIDHISQINDVSELRAIQCFTQMQIAISDKLTDGKFVDWGFTKPWS